MACIKNKIGAIIKIMKKILPAILLAVFIFSLLPAKIYASEINSSATLSGSLTVESSNSAIPVNNFISDPAFNLKKQYYLNALNIISFLHLTSCILVGERCLGEYTSGSVNKVNLPGNLDKLYPDYKDGLLGVTTNLMAATLSYPPSSLSYSLSQLKNSIIPVKSAYGQSPGLGMNALSVFSSLWVIGRNISYTFIIIILIVIGFLLIFNYKINPSTYIDLEKVIIRTVLVILAITLSFAISGLFIDLMYLALLMIFNLAKHNNLAGAKAIETLYGNVTVDQIFSFLTVQSDPNILVQSLTALIPKDFMMIIQTLLSTIIGIQSYPATSSALHDIATFIETSVGASFIGSFHTEFDPGAMAASVGAIPFSMMLGGIIAPLIINLVLTIAIYLGILFLYFKILFMLIGSYVEIVFQTIFSPFILVFDILPNRNHFVIWCKRLIANVITFPLLAALFLAGTSISQAIAGSSEILLPPPLSGIGHTMLATIVGIGILLAIPNMINRVKKWIVPEHTIVDFPTTPGALLGTVASIAPFVPGIMHLTSSIGAFKIGKQPPAAEKSNKEVEFPHMPEAPKSDSSA